MSARSLINLLEESSCVCTRCPFVELFSPFRDDNQIILAQKRKMPQHEFTSFQFQLMICFYSVILLGFHKKKAQVTQKYSGSPMLFLFDVQRRYLKATTNLCLYSGPAAWKCSGTLQVQVKCFFFQLIRGFDIQLTSCIFLWLFFFFKLTIVQVSTGSLIFLQPPPHHNTAAKSQHITKSDDYIAIHSYYPRGGKHEPFQTAALQLTTAAVPAFPRCLGCSSQKHWPLMIVEQHLSILNDSVHRALMGRTLP